MPSSPCKGWNDSSRQRHQVRGDEARAQGTGSTGFSRPELRADRTAPGTRGCPRGWHQINTQGILLDFQGRRPRPWLPSLPIRGRWLRTSTARKSARISESGGHTRAPHAVRKEHRDQACVFGVGAQRHLSSERGRSGYIAVSYPAEPTRATGVLGTLG